MYLSGLNMRYVFDIVKRLSTWIQSGVYDFYSLPTSMKTELDEVVCDEIQSKLQQSKGDTITNNVILGVACNNNNTTTITCFF